MVQGQGVPPAEPRLRRHGDCSRKSGVTRRWVELAVIAVRTCGDERELIGPPGRAATISAAATRRAECAAIPHAAIARCRMRGRPGITPCDAGHDLTRHCRLRDR